MRQFDIVENTNPETRNEIPLLLVLQSDLFGALGTRVVAPLLPSSRRADVLDRLNPEFEINGITYILSTTELAGVPTRALGRTVATVQERRPDILAALDFLITGS
jgi:toxin CcdB